MARRISKLKWARAVERPAIFANYRPRGAKRQGLKYESRLALAIPSASHGQWFEFEDVNGLGYCQTDLIFECLDRKIGILEAKYTWTEEGHRQIENLYLPVVESAFGCSAFGAVATKKLLPFMPNVMIVNNIEAMLSAMMDKRKVCLHWIGEGQIPGIALCKPIRHFQMVA